MLLAGCRDPAPPVPDSGDDPPGFVAFDDTTDRVASRLASDHLNHLLPQHVAVDDARRRVYATSNAFEHLLVVDADTHALLDVVDLGALGPHRNGLEVDPDGQVWVSAGETPALVAWDPATDAVLSPQTGLLAVASLTSRQGGGVVALGATVDGDAMQVIDPEGALVTSEGMTRATFGLTTSRAGDLVVFHSPGGGSPSELRVVSTDDLSLRYACQPAEHLDHPAKMARVHEVDSGRFVAVWDTDVAVLSCRDEEPWVVTTIGAENKSAVAVDDGFLVFDRLAPETDEAPLHGVARRFDLALGELAEPVDTGKNSGYAASDPATGHVWLNSEGTSELLVLDAATGEIVDRVRTGEHVETIVADPAGGVAWYTGRLNDAVARVDFATGEVTLAEGPFVWPVAPVLLDGRLYVLGQMTHELTVLDPDTLQVEARLPVDVPVNPALTFASMVAHPTRGTLLFTHSGEHRLVEVDPSTGDVVNAWALTGAPPEDLDTPARLEVVTGADVALVVRSQDLLASRVDLVSGEVSAVDLGEEAVAGLREATGQLERLSPVLSTGIVYVGGYAFDAASLERAPDADVPADRVVGEIDGHLLAWSGDAAELLLLDGDGAIEARLAVDLAEDAAPTFRLAGERVYVTDLERATVREVGLGNFVR